MTNLESLFSLKYFGILSITGHSVLHTDQNCYLTVEGRRCNTEVPCRYHANDGTLSVNHLYKFRPAPENPQVLTTEHGYFQKKRTFSQLNRCI